jgi:hypothetical protein
MKSKGENIQMERCSLSLKERLPINNPTKAMRHFSSLNRGVQSAWNHIPSIQFIHTSHAVQANIKIALAELKRKTPFANWIFGYKGGKKGEGRSLTNGRNPIPTTLTLTRNQTIRRKDTLRSRESLSANENALREYSHHNEQVQSDPNPPVYRIETSSSRSDLTWAEDAKTKTFRTKSARRISFLCQTRNASFPSSTPNTAFARLLPHAQETKPLLHTTNFAAIEISLIAVGTLLCVWSF